MDQDLFSRVALDDLSIEVRETERIVIEKSVIIDGVVFDAVDLYDTLLSLDDEADIVVVDDDMANMLLKYAAISYRGNMRHCARAEKGANFNAFYKLILEQIS